MLNLVQLRVLDAVARHGSVTDAAKALHYTQPAVSHHLARLEAQTGAQLLQRIGRGIRLTQAGQVLASRAAEIIGRVDAADAELAAHVGLSAGRVRLASFSSAIGSLVLPAVAIVSRDHPGLDVSVSDMHPPEALKLLRAGQIDIALVFRYEDTEPEPEGVRLHHLLDDPVYLLSKQRSIKLSRLRDAVWVAGCERCRNHLLALCAKEGFTPAISYTTDDLIVLQTLVAAGIGVTTIPGLALRGHRIKGFSATKLKDADRQVYAATYGQPPDPPATAALLSGLSHAAKIS
jgi:DNA-binding transcriptional LysR family regulator